MKERRLRTAVLLIFLISFTGTGFHFHVLSFCDMLSVLYRDTYIAFLRTAAGFFPSACHGCKQDLLQPLVYH